MNTFNSNANDLFQNVKMVISETKKPKVSPNVCAIPAPAKKLKNSDIFLYPKCKMEEPSKQEDVAVKADKEPETPPPTLDAPIKRDVGERGKDKKLRKKRRDHNTPERLAQLAKAREKALTTRRINSKRRKQEKEEALRKKYAPPVPAPPASPAPPKATPKKPKYTKEQVEASMFSMLDKWDNRRQMRKRKAKEEEVKKAALERKKPSSSDKKIPSLYARNQQTNWDSLFY
jgi:hypothetical protein